MAKAIPPAGGNSYTLTLKQCVELFQSVGIPMDNKKLSEGIKAGIYPGRILNVGATGRHSFEIWRCDVEAFLQEKKPKGEIV